MRRCNIVKREKDIKGRGREMEECNLKGRRKRKKSVWERSTHGPLVLNKISSHKMIDELSNIIKGCFMSHLVINLGLFLDESRDTK